MAEKQTDYQKAKKAIGCEYGCSGGCTHKPRARMVRLIRRERAKARKGLMEELIASTAKRKTDEQKLKEAVYWTGRKLTSGQVYELGNLLKRERGKARAEIRLTYVKKATKAKTPKIIGRHLEI